MSLLNDVLRDLEKREGGQSARPPDGVPPGLLIAGVRNDRSDAGIERGQLMRLIVWVLVLLTLITAAIVGWRSLSIGQQALDRIPVDENLQAVPRTAPETLSGITPVEPLSASITSSAAAPHAALEPVRTSQYAVPETAPLSGPAPGEPDRRPDTTTYSASDNSNFLPIEATPDPAVTIVKIPDEPVSLLATKPPAPAVAKPQTMAGSSLVQPEPKPEPELQPKPEPRPKPEPQPEQNAMPAEGTSRSAPVVRTQPSAQTESITLIARRLDEARVMQAQGQTQAALDHLEGLDQSYITSASAPALNSFRAGLLQQQGRWQEAASLYSSLLQGKSDSPTLAALESRWWSGLAIAQEQLEQPARAHAAWLNALSAGELPVAMRSYAAIRIDALGQAGIEPDYQTVLHSTSVESRQNRQQESP